MQQRLRDGHRRGGGVPSEGMMASRANGDEPGAADAAAALSPSITAPTAGECTFLWAFFFIHSRHSPRLPLLHGTGSRARDNGDGRWGRGAGLWSSGGCRGPGIPGAVCGRLPPGGPLGPLSHNNQKVGSPGRRPPQHQVSGVGWEQLGAAGACAGEFKWDRETWMEGISAKLRGLS